MDHSPVNGSSPLARGLPAALLGLLALARIIPARAGFTGGRAGPRARRPDHPRSRGIYGLHGLFRRMTPGSSPLARGLPPTTKKGGRPNRIIPARAGFTRGMRASCPSTQDHPRSRGVYSRPVSWPSSSAGSSPLARGLLLPGRIFRLISGIIPARAGFTCGTPCIRRWASDHPRSRGVYVPNETGLYCDVGSSPLARGLPCYRRNQYYQYKDHPRSRGVYRL